MRILDIKEVKHDQKFYTEVCLKIACNFVFILYFHTCSDAIKFHVCLKENQTIDDC